MSATTAPEYELVLMLDPEASEERRDEIVAAARDRIERAGELKADTAWGMRKLAYEIRQRTEADYRFFRFGTGGALLSELDHNLKIADGVLRFRLFKVDARAPVIVPPPPTPLAAGSARGERRGPGRGRDGGPRGRREGGPPREAGAPREDSPRTSTVPAEEPAEAGPPASAAPADAEAPPGESEPPAGANGQAGSDESG